MTTVYTKVFVLPQGIVRPNDVTRGGQHKWAARFPADACLPRAQKTTMSGLYSIYTSKHIRSRGRTILGDACTFPREVLTSHDEEKGDACTPWTPNERIQRLESRFLTFSTIIRLFRGHHFGCVCYVCPSIITHGPSMACFGENLARKVITYVCGCVFFCVLITVCGIPVGLVYYCP